MRFCLSNSKVWIGKITILQRWQMKFKGTNWTFFFSQNLLSRRSLPWLESILSSEQFLFPNKYKYQSNGCTVCCWWRWWLYETGNGKSGFTCLSKKIVTIIGQKTEQKFEACCHSECYSGTPSELCCKTKWPVFDIS